MIALRAAAEKLGNYRLPDCGRSVRIYGQPDWVYSGQCLRNAGFRVDLPPGRYRTSVVREGVPVPGSERSLRVVSAAGRDDIVADVVPEERWTRPLASNSARSRIYARPGATFYVALAEATRFTREHDLVTVPDELVVES